MKKISEKEIVQAIISEALTIKRKRQLFEEAKKINAELKQLNEYGHPGVMAGYGFKGYEGPSPVLGLVTPSTYEEEKPEDKECGCKLDQFSKLEKDVEGFGDETEVETDDIQALKDENEELKEKLAQIQDALNTLNEGLFKNAVNKVKAGWQGLKAGVNAGIQAGTQAGQQEFEKTQQAQAAQAEKDDVTKAIKDFESLKKSAQSNPNLSIGAAQPSAILAKYGLAFKNNADKKSGVIFKKINEADSCDSKELDEIFGINTALKKGKEMFKGAIAGAKQGGQEFDASNAQRKEKIATTIDKYINALNVYLKQLNQPKAQTAAIEPANQMKAAAE